MDEPSSALDPRNRRIVIRTIQSLPQTKLIASHDLDMILDTCDRVILMNAGRVVADGSADAVLRDRALLEANRLELLRGERLYEESMGDAREAVGRAMMEFERLLSRQDRGEIERGRRELSRLLDRIEFGTEE